MIVVHFQINNILIFQVINEFVNVRTVLLTAKPVLHRVDLHQELALQRQTFGKLLRERALRGEQSQNASFVVNYLKLEDRKSTSMAQNIISKMFLVSDSTVSRWITALLSGFNDRSVRHVFR